MEDETAPPFSTGDTPSETRREPDQPSYARPDDTRRATERKRAERKGPREDFLCDIKGGSLRSPPAARLRALAALASSPATAHASTTPRSDVEQPDSTTGRRRFRAARTVA